MPTVFPPLQVDRMAADCGLELRPHNVAFVSLWPGAVKTELLTEVVNSDQEGVKDVVRLIFCRCHVCGSKKNVKLLPAYVNGCLSSTKLVNILRFSVKKAMTKFQKFF